MFYSYESTFTFNSKINWFYNTFNYKAIFIAVYTFETTINEDS